MNILFIGFMLRQEDVLRHPGASVAGNSMQLDYVKHLMTIGHNVRVLSYVPIAFFPKSRRLWIPSKEIQLSDQMTATSPGFLNLPWIKMLMQSYSAKKHIKKWLEVTGTSHKTIITYNAIYQIARPIMRLSLSTRVKKVCILADPPLIQLNHHTCVAALKKRIYKKEEKLIALYDGIIALNENAANHYAPGKPYLVIEGGVNAQSVSESKHPFNDVPRRFVYSGALTSYSGCLELINAFTMIAYPDVELSIYGTGPLLKEVEAYAKLDKRIHYRGYLASDAIKSIYREAHFLVNPRHMNDEISKYSFSSKLFDYLLSETPVLSTAFPGLPDEYLPFFHVLPSEKAEDLKDSLLSVLHSDYSSLKKRAVDARKWMIREKSWTHQIKRLSDWIDQLHETEEMV